MLGEPSIISRVAHDVDLKIWIPTSNGRPMCRKLFWGKSEKNSNLTNLNSNFRVFLGSQVKVHRHHNGAERHSPLPLNITPTYYTPLESRHIGLYDERKILAENFFGRPHGPFEFEFSPKFFSQKCLIFFGFSTPSQI